MLAGSLYIAPAAEAEAADQTEYEIYPTPHVMTYEDGDYIIRDEVNVVYESGIDEATKDRLNETLALKSDISVEESDSIVDGMTNILVGIDGSGEYVDNYVDENIEVTTEGLFDELDSYVLDSGDGVITVLGADTDASFYGLTSLYHIIKQMDSYTIRNFHIEDWADVASRGFIEGYYGNPWSTEDRINLMTWGGYYKLNSYFYAPKNDPKHNSNWRQLYTDEEIETLIKPLADAGNASKCRFVYALHTFMNNAVRFDTEEHYQEDLAIVQAKFEQVIEAGVRQVAILADDAANVGADNYIKFLNDMTDWLAEMGKKYPDLKQTLPFCTVEYMYNGQSYYQQFPENVQIVMTGGRIWGEVSNSFTETFTNTAGRGPYMWINWPCTDNSKNHLIMGGYSTFLHPGVDPAKIQGIVLNPMQQSEPSKVAIFGNACYSWNIWETEEEADLAWNNSFKYVDHNSAIETEGSNALRELSKHMMNQNMDSRVTALQESVDLAPMLTAFKDKLNSNTVTAEDVDALIAEFEVLQDAADIYEAQAGDTNVRDQIIYWL
ncbi:MAG TPA: beta-N-acetylglucosaminidase domain-containing protein, partial [Candidatus Mediterraneibacter caccogallinarum]|nr:beta-N-acetylglucosaminidase domain-containing protein [Candidatus Mediterraneibacter caccogallinarum]